MLKYSEEIQSLEKKNFGSTFTNFNNFVVDVIDKNGTLEAYLIYQAVLEETEIISIYVKPEYRRKGLASILLTNLQKKYQTIFLEVNENNQVAKYLYEHLGFTEYARRFKYYNNKDTAILMKWSR